jgi:hypothetical protein
MPICTCVHVYSIINTPLCVRVEVVVVGGLCRTFKGVCAGCVRLQNSCMHVCPLRVCLCFLLCVCGGGGGARSSMHSTVIVSVHAFVLLDIREHKVRPMHVRACLYMASTGSMLKKR